ncbi:MAG: U32 family peptidase [Actinobacteria bacterium]|nr:MAG: U32 family peptidase [Actinomycetota bacterium]
MTKANVKETPERSMRHAGPPELLAPAGDEKSLVAAVQSGADAVYLGLQQFGARRGAKNFSRSQFADAVRYAHLRGCKAYLTLNVLILPEEIPAVLEAAEGAREAGADAFIVQDLGLAALLRGLLPDVPLHASTQISTHTPDGVAAAARFGFKRVTLARELSLAQVARLAAGELPVEVFVHGALCYCYSGQCLLSSMAGGRSGNRGLCVQACRLPYELVEAGKRVDAGGPHPLSTRDLSAIALIPDLVRAGAAAFKIEGRLKSHVYVSTVVDVYRRAIDRFVEDPSEYSVPAEDLRILEEVFTRGFTEAYLSAVKDRRIMAPARPSARGVLIGRVAACEKGYCRVKLGRELSAGDEVEAWVRKGGRIRTTVEWIRVAGEKVGTAAEGQLAEIELAAGVGEGDRIFRTAKASVEARARELLRPSKGRRLVPVDMRATIRPGRPVSLEASSEGKSVSVKGAVVEEATGAGLDPASVEERLARLGGTPYRAHSVAAGVAPSSHLPLRELTRAKQQLIERLDEERLLAWRRGRVSPSYSPPAPRRRRSRRPALAVAADSLATAEAVAEEGADSLYFDISFERDRKRLARTLPGLAQAARGAGTEFALLMPAIARSPELEYADSLVDALGDRLDVLIAGNLGQIERYRGRVRSLAGDFPLNVTNSETVESLAELGLSRVGLSLELAGAQIADIVSRTALPLEVLGFGQLQVMVAEHCLYSSPESCRRCAGREGLIRDEKGFEFTVRTDCACRSRIYNPFQLSLLRQVSELADEGIDVIRLNLIAYSARDAAGVVKGWRNALALLPSEKETAMEIAAELDARLSSHRRFTTGHYFRPLP